ncbi:hypothetical protein KHA93_22015 [Bacillus sp. FJAT-49732]|uniref:HTH merR-type domain-containing protein n=1 Tax=Lederbergia citrisecunda TaxID=2833583 RepID=A0A942YN27_9BACI|nr:hypothetical protein [Lederbergia citrisecunda]MBS4202292.1 hypothetical protein [Lederbergia citrisecunda]
MERHIFSSEAAKTLGIGASTIRKYAALLETNGYEFERGTNNGRIFKHADLTVISNMMEMMTKEGLTIELAVEKAVGNTPIKEKPVTEINQDLQDFIGQIKDLEMQQASLIEMNLALAKQVESLTEKMEERERDQQLFRMVEDSRNKKKRKGIALFRPLTVLSGKK